MSELKVGEEMLSKLEEVVPVQVYLVRMKCPNPQCGGVLEADGKTRTEGGLHGAPVQYRHICAECGAGAWLKKSFPQVTYREMETVADESIQ